MNQHSNNPSRRTLLKMAALGLLGPAGISGVIREALANGDMPGRSEIHTLKGTATLNGKEAKAGALVKPGDRVATGKASQAVVIVDGDAFLMRESTEIVIDSAKTATTVQIVTGKILSVFAKRRDTEKLNVRIPVGTIGIRGTGMYVEASEERTYFCLCYGEAVIDGKNMAPRTVKTTHHESPLWLYESSDSMKVDPGPFLNHTDDELIMLESLCGRKPPFVGTMYPGGKY